MRYLLALLLLAATPLAAQSKTPLPTTPLTTAGRVTQYYQDYLARLREVYFATGDPRATALLSTATEELSARRRGLRAELKAAGTATVAPPPTWAPELAELLKTPQAAKFADRCRRNPALETAYQRFVDAGLDKLTPAESR
ncbi:hypothetical protein [Hymenobacter jeollabukensis]|uniref:Uncharacterized protein n=1 Tax=Hymenobacter jeollabukensis TaxID=2025313 RepID=A0A5R8WQC0_9BACT|nr:hypothetical protein [Hymenobacter jeollabukensis]TLM92309.1 hypothetical protein FDY95_12810 [Hymenobacter jeollabukensis]